MPLKDCLAKLNLEGSARFFSDGDARAIEARSAKVGERKALEEALEETTKQMEAAIKASAPKKPNFEKGFQAVIGCIGKQL